MSDLTDLPTSSVLLSKIDEISKTLHSHITEFAQIQALVRKKIRAEGTVDHAWNEVRFYSDSHNTHSINSNTHTHTDDKIDKIRCYYKNGVV